MERPSADAKLTQHKMATHRVRRSDDGVRFEIVYRMMSLHA